MVRFYGMPLLSAKCPKPPGRREISNMNEDLGNHSKDQSYYLMHGLDISTPRETKPEFINLKEIISRIFLVMLYSLGDFGKKTFSSRHRDEVTSHHQHGLEIEVIRA